MTEAVVQKFLAARQRNLQRFRPQNAQVALELDPRPFQQRPASKAFPEPRAQRNRPPEERTGFGRLGF
eukprot:202664-Alexandrium_andersonii.AAC.1